MQSDPEEFLYKKAWWAENYLAGGQPRRLLLLPRLLPTREMR